MKSKSLILIVIACGCGLVASIGISQVMDRGGGKPAEVETSQILVALTDININDSLDAKNVKLENWPKDRVPEGAIAKLEDVKDEFTRTRLYKGEPILKVKLTTTRGGDRTIPEGYRVMPIRVEGNVFEAIQPGDRVDILVFMQKGSEVPVATTKTVLTDVRIYAVNDKTERGTKDKENEYIQARNVSVLVKPDQVEMLGLAMEIGKIKLSLRRPDDKKEVLGKGETNLNDLFQRESQLGTDPVASVPAGPAPGGHNLSQFIKDQVGAHQPAADVPDGPSKTMLVHTPQGTVKYIWREGSDVPEVTTTSETAPAAAPPALPAPRAATVPDGDKNSGPAAPQQADNT